MHHQKRLTFLKAKNHTDKEFLEKKTIQFVLRGTI